MRLHIKDYLKSGCMLVPFAFVLLAVLPACSIFRSKADLSKERVAAEYFRHQIGITGETLSLIAAWYTGSADNWQVLAQHNPGLDFNRLQIGSVVLIPRSMLRRQTPLTVEAVRATRREIPAPSPKPANLEPRQSEEPAKPPLAEATRSSGRVSPAKSGDRDPASAQALQKRTQSAPALGRSTTVPALPGAEDANTESKTRSRNAVLQELLDEDSPVAEAQQNYSDSRNE